jgi:hypothetical protein
MITIDSFNKIKQWFEKNDTVEFDLPDGHFGRPADGGDTVIKIGIEGKFFIVILNTQDIRKFFFHGDINYEIVNGCLEISNFDSLVFEWQPAEETIFNTKLYESGMVRFIPNYKYFPKNWRP